jgi:hypothetical protein
VLNRNQRKILVLKKPIYIESIDEIQYEDFDATFINYTSGYSVNISIIWSVLPMLKNKCWLKPTFLSTLFKERFMHMADVVDGFADSPLDEDMAARIEEIEETIQKSGVVRKRDKVYTNEDLFINFCRFCLSRGNKSMYNNSVKYYGKGYTKMLYSLFGENYFIDTAIRFNQVLRDLGYVTEKRFVERLHVCPVCANSHLFFIECCPSCKSSAISCQPVIHHFRCANISPESTYEYDGELRCPKCKRFLHHIGVDYDRPASVYQCDTCGNSFANPFMRVICTSCKRTFEPEELSTFDVREYRFTDSGEKAMVTDEIKLNMSRNVFVGYSNYDDFMRTMKMMLMSSSKNPETGVLVVRMQLPKDTYMEAKQQKSMLVEMLLMHLPDYKITLNNEYVFVMKSLLDVQEMASRTLDKARSALGEAIGAEINEHSEGIFNLRHFLFQRGVRSLDFINDVTGKVNL